jgi:hypothetical protein
MADTSFASPEGLPILTKGLSLSCSLSGLWWKVSWSVVAISHNASIPPEPLGME